MTAITRRATGSSILALAIALAPATAAAAAVAPAPHPKPGASAKAGKPAPPRNTMVVCNHSGYMLGVWAYGPGSVRTTDLAGSYDECVSWKRLASGFHEVGFDFRVPSQQNVLLQMRVKYDGRTFYKSLPGGTSTLMQLAQDKTAKIDFFIPRG